MNVIMCSGHGDLTKEEFDEHYKSRLDKELWKNSMFVVGDYVGADTMIQDYLKENKESHHKVIVFHMFENPRYNAGFPTIGNFQNDQERDSAMSDCSTDDFLWVRPGKEGSGTDQNRIRRNNPKNNYVQKRYKK